MNDLQERLLATMAMRLFAGFGDNSDFYDVTNVNGEMIIKGSEIKAIVEKYYPPPYFRGSVET